MVNYVHYWGWVIGVGELALVAPTLGIGARAISQRIRPASCAQGVQLARLLWDLGRVAEEATEGLGWVDRLQ